MYKSGKGVEYDVALAIDYFQKGVDCKHIGCMYNLAVLYDFEAPELCQISDKAIYYYQMAVSYGHAGAMNNLGVCYKEGTGVEQDYQTAFDLFYQAAMLDDAHAYLNLAYCYKNGEGCQERFGRSTALV